MQKNQNEAVLKCCLRKTSMKIKSSPGRQLNNINALKWIVFFTTLIKIITQHTSDLRQFGPLGKLTESILLTLFVVCHK